MTREEAIAYFEENAKIMEQPPIHLGSAVSVVKWAERCDRMTEAFGMAIAALEEQGNCCKKGNSSWISVEDRLPSLDATKTDDFGRQKSVRVLCVCKQKSGKVFVKEGYYVVGAGDGVYWRIPGSIDSVTHWMPLPEPQEVDV